jgi:shikimate kinase
MLLASTDLNLILTGYTGPNQPRIGQQAAERLKLRYVNVELQLEARAEMPLDEFRARYGETRLKTLEAEVMRDLLLHRGSVIRVSGEMLLRGDYHRRLAETGPVLCLTVTLDAVLRRLHLSLGARYHNPHERALAIGQLKREWAVRRLPDIHEIDSTYMNEEATVARVVETWQSIAISIQQAAFGVGPIASGNGKNGKNGHSNGSDPNKTATVEVVRVE